jgi:hypothetical protein
MSFLPYIKFSTEDTKAKHTNITTKLNQVWKLFTKVIKQTSEESLGL